MRVIIAGSRTIDDYPFVRDQIDVIASTNNVNITEVVSGHAKGVDRLGERWAIENNINLTIFPAEWNEYGWHAGLIRNLQMADYADALIAIMENESNGTAHMIKTAQERGLEVFVTEIKS